MKVALDTNILAYAEGVDGDEKRDTVLSLIRSLPQDAVVVPVQVLGELFNVLVRKAKRSRAEARNALLSWRTAFQTIETGPDVLQAAMDLATDHRFGIWDAVILSAASRAGCRLLILEDLQDGFAWGGVTIIDPFASPPHALLGAVSRRPSG